jgi:hypothetical protein
MQNHAKKWFKNTTSANAMTAIAIGAMLIFSAAGIKAFGDVVQANDVDTNTNSATITEGDSTTVKYRIVANNGDNQAGCNAADTSPATVNLQVPSGVTADKSSLKFTSCGTDQSVTYSSSTAGTYTIPVSVSDSGTGTYNTSPAKFTLTVNPKDTTAPTISITSPNDGDTVNTNSFTVKGTASDSGGVKTVEVKIDSGSYSTATGTETWSFDVSNYPEGTHTITAKATDNNGNSDTKSIQVTYTPPDTTPPELKLPADITEEATSAEGAKVTFSATANDAKDGAVTVVCTPASGSTFALGTTTVDCSATDKSDNTAQGSFRISVVDTTSPVLKLPADITQEATGPDGAAVTYDASASDLVDGSLTPTCLPASGSTFALGTTTVDCSATDKSDNTAQGSFSVTVKDTTPPTVTPPSDISNVEATGSDGAKVTYGGATGSDLVDGSLTPTCLPASGSTFALGTTTVTCSATDAAGNTGAGTFKITVVDTTAPKITVTSAISDGQKFYFGDVPTSAPTCNATDLVSGEVTCTVSGYGTAVGSYTLTFTATDKAGNTATQTIKYTVLAWTLKGFYQPTDMTGVTNTVKYGSTVPLKWQVFKGGTELTDVSYIKSVTQKQVSCDPSAPTDAVEEVITTTGGTVLRYDTTSHQFVDNWSTKPLTAGKCYNAIMTTQDGSTLVATFKPLK